MKRNALQTLVIILACLFLLPFSRNTVHAANNTKPVIKVENDLAGKVKLTWNEVKNAGKYWVFRANKKDGLYERVAVKKKCQFLDKDTSDRKEYYYKVWAVTYSFNKKGKLKDVIQKSSKIQKVYARPKSARVVLLGECYAVGMNLWAKQYLGANDRVFGKEGISSYGLMTRNCISYQGQTITMLDRAGYYKPDRVYFLVGMNECVSGNVQAALSNFQKAHEQLKRINPYVDIVLMAVGPTGKTSSLNIPSLQQRLSWNEALNNYTNGKAHTFYYDYSPLLDDGQGYIQVGYDGGDGCHWNSAATCLVTQNWLQWDSQTFQN